MVEGTKRPFVLTYVRSHWRGEQPLWRSFWVNTVLLSLAVDGLIGWQLALPDEQRYAWFVLFCLALGGVLVVWQLVGLWRSARRVRRQRLRRFWSIAAQLFIIVNLMVVAFIVSITGVVVYAVIKEVDNPTSRAPFEIVREGEVVRFTGPIHAASAERLLAILDDPGVHELAIESEGGFTSAAAAIAEKIHARRFAVTVEDYCNSACVLLLAASPAAAVMPYSTSVLHRAHSVFPEWMQDLLRPDTESGDVEYTKELSKYHVTPDAILKILALSPEAIWSPTLRELGAMNLVMFVYSEENDDYMRFREFCANFPERCD
ncbi:MAG: hypothetical protein U1E45_23605 [Geminicoccaceae bacterium]